MSFKSSSVTFEHVKKAYGSVLALNDFSVKIENGEFVTLLGASGSGKTTVLNLIAGFFRQTSGRILIGEREISSLPPERRNLGVVFQHYSLFPMMTVAENVAYPLKMRRLNKDDISKRVTKALETVRMSAFADRLPKNLSGGQQQRVAFARAIVYEPPVLLMDEPLAALDQNLREELQSEIRDYHSQLGCTIIFVTHDQREALQLSDRVAVMHNGKMEQIGTPHDIYSRPNTRYIAEFIGKSNIFDAQRVGSDFFIPALGLSGSFKGSGSCAVIRPEKIEISKYGSGQSGTIKKLTFLGDASYVEADLDGHGLIIQISGDKGNNYKVGDQIKIKAKADDVVLTNAE
ncbi:ABC transporter ATP-binding protein [Brucella anthropi]|uniref:ABC transporter ATP-binding protein n=1 Tax=Brucella anthropi TaxID=529 RepID=UPI001CFD8E6E